jgi:protein SCO1/2
MKIFLGLLFVLASWGQAQYRGGIVTPALPKPNFVLTDTSGSAFDFRKQTEEMVTLLFFGYTYCPDQCPMHMATLAAALKKLPPEITGQVKLVFVTTDPARDTPHVLRKWLDQFDKRSVGLTGNEAAIEAVQKSAGVPSAYRTDIRNGGYGVAHANFVIAYTKDNRAHVIYPGGIGKDDWVHDLPLLVQETWSNANSR